VQWIASSARLVHAVWHDYEVLVSHYETTSNDPERNSKDEATYKRLKMILTDTYFVLNMGLLLDALTQLEDLA
jgi:uncharacterized membrane-anchored protein YhcB (DUF1043 family)